MTEIPDTAVSFKSAARLIVERAITECDDGPAERKRRILYAREHGIFSDQETTDWIAIYEVQAA
jgi:hypothetical protein